MWKIWEFSHNPTCENEAFYQNNGKHSVSLCSSACWMTSSNIWELITKCLKPKSTSEHINSIFTEVFTRLQKREINTYTHPPCIHYLTTLVTMTRNLQWRLNGVLRLKWRFSLSVLPTPWRRRGQHLPYHLKFINVFDQAVSAICPGSFTYYCNSEHRNVRCYGVIQPPSPKNAHYTYQCLHTNLSTRSTPLAFWSQAHLL
jgi:hypothetical protein